MNSFNFPNYRFYNNYTNQVTELDFNSLNTSDVYTTNVVHNSHFYRYLYRMADKIILVTAIHEVNKDVFSDHKDLTTFYHTAQIRTVVY